MKSCALALIVCSSSLVAVASCARAREAPIACGDVAEVPAPLEKVTLWETSRLDERTPKAPKVEGVRLEVHPAPGVTRAALEHALRCGVGKLGARLQLERVVDVNVSEDGLRYLVWARFASRQDAERVVEALKPWVPVPR